MPAGRASPAASASVQPFLRSNGASRPCTYCPTRSRGSLRANRGAIRRCSSVRPSAHAATSVTSTSSPTPPDKIFSVEEEQADTPS
jgi:hypothetical protein